MQTVPQSLQEESRALQPLQLALETLNFPKEEINSQLSELIAIIGIRVIQYAQRQKEGLNDFGSNESIIDAQEEAYANDLNALIGQAVDEYTLTIRDSLNSTDKDKFDLALQ